MAKEKISDNETTPFDYLASQNTDADFIDVLLDAEREVLVEEGDDEAIEIHDAEAAKIKNGTADDD